MAKIEIEYCDNCKRETEHGWTVDNDSEPNEPIFNLCCQVCGNEQQ